MGLYLSKHWELNLTLTWSTIFFFQRVSQWVLPIQHACNDCWVGSLIVLNLLIVSILMDYMFWISDIFIFLAKTVFKTFFPLNLLREIESKFYYVCCLFLNVIFNFGFSCRYEQWCWSKSVPIASLQNSSPGQYQFVFTLYGMCTAYLKLLCLWFEGLSRLPSFLAFARKFQGIVVL